MSVQREKAEKKPARPRRRAPHGLVAGILPLQEEILQLINFYIDIVTTALDYLKEEAERIGRRFQAERGDMPLDNRLRFMDAFMDYRKKRQELSGKLGHLAAYKRGMDALHDLVGIETDADRLKKLHEMKVELMMNVLRILIDIMKDLNKMSDDLRRAENNLSI